MIEVKNLTKWYGPVLAVDDVSFNVQAGRIVGFLGPNGAGKSTTLKILTCYLPPSSGVAKVDGFDVLSDSLEVRRRIGYMPESVPLYTEMRVREYLMFRAALREIPYRQRRVQVDRACQRCWLSHPEDMTRRRIGELSRGYRQRVGLAEALLHNPPVLILDEPTVGLDPVQIRSMRELIRELGADHTVILSSHILAEVEQTCQEIVMIAGGRIAAQGTVDQLRQRVAGSTVVAEIRGASAQEIATALKQIGGVKDVRTSEHGNWHVAELTASADSDPRAAIHEMVSSKGWKLRELRRQSKTLEDFFIKIHYEQNVRRGA